MPATTIELFEAAKQIIKAKEKESVDLSAWLEDEVGVVTSCEFDEKLGVQRNICGTIACGGGWIAQDGQFNRLGLSLEKNLDDYIDIVCRKDDKVTSSFAALGNVFGISEDAAELVFAGKYFGDWDYGLDPDRDLSDKKLLLKRINKMIKKLKNGKTFHDY